MTNSVFLRNFVASALHTAFPHLNKCARPAPHATCSAASPRPRRSSQIQSFVVGLFNLNTDLVLFKSQLRDFLIQLKVGRGRWRPAPRRP
jgi:hypothetical protein